MAIFEIIDLDSQCEVVDGVPIHHLDCSCPNQGRKHTEPAINCWCHPVSSTPSFTVYITPAGWTCTCRISMTYATGAETSRRGYDHASSHQNYGSKPNIHVRVIDYRVQTLVHAHDVVV